MFSRFYLEWIRLLRKLLLNPRTIPRFAGMMLIYCVSWGCGLTMGPQTKQEVVILKAGKPVQILQNSKVKARELETGAIVEVDVGGWTSMPNEHWEAIKRALEEKKTP